MRKSVNRKVFAGALSMMAVVAACSDDQDKKPSCTSAQLESDLEASPFMGPGADPVTGELKLTAGRQYMVSSTYGVPVRGPDGAPVTAEYGEIFAAVEQQLAKESGLVAFKLASSAACKSGRTLAVWDSEDAMYAFVVSPAHARAMQRADAILQPGYGVTHWEAGRKEEMTFEKGVQMLAEE